MNVKIKLVSMPGHQPSGFDEFGNAVLNLDSGTTVSQMMGQLNLSNLESYMVLVNGETVPPSEHTSYQMKDGDEAAIFPPMEGG